MDNNTLTKFDNLLGRLSPENLHCDGEISAAQARKRLTVIRREWKALEKTLGRKVTEDEVYRTLRVREKVARAVDPETWAASGGSAGIFGFTRGFNNRHED